ncbi:hypothetical protein [Pseudonocardia endophytica]|uniref:Uncharacterized protein n=1 Tax=Pseudonocardia endophytica TaxID=401976 RepID=A0A4R1HHT0_PSEEN|nr:hypothetical protein [Pseudonocardia endophytica]TCK21787.1 hypothetical protein EV378_5778 [Pseudonocardia endophytica]
MSVVGIVELLAWLISAAIAIWMAQDMIRVARGHDEASLVNAPDPLEEPYEPPATAERGSA